MYAYCIYYRLYNTYSSIQTVNQIFSTTHRTSGHAYSKLIITHYNNTARSAFSSRRAVLILYIQTSYVHIKECLPQPDGRSYVWYRRRLLPYRQSFLYTNIIWSKNMLCALGRKARNEYEQHPTTRRRRNVHCVCLFHLYACAAPHT